MAHPDKSSFITFGPDSNCTLDLCPIEWSVYEYQPSLAANVVFIVLFAVAMAAHTFLGVRWRSWWFMWCMLAGCVDEILGYAGRVWMSYNPFKFEAFMIQIVCITIGPVFFCAAIYVVLAQTINTFGPSLSRFPPRLFYWIFIPCDIVSLILQGAGGGMSTTSSGTNQTGVDLALAGLAFQVFTLLAFSILYVDYLVRYYRSPLAAAAANEADADVAGGVGKGGGRRGLRLKVFYGFISAAIVLILARCAFRVDELSEGYGGALVHNEGIFIGLEGVLIVVSVFALCIGHPGLIFLPKGTPGAGSVLESGTESVEK